MNHTDVLRPGRPVKLHLRGDEAFGGVAVRWGTVAEVTAGAVVLDGYHDSAGIGAGMGGGQHDGVRVDLSEVLEAFVDWRHTPEGRETYADHQRNRGACAHCHRRIHKQRDGTWYHDRNGSTSCRPGQGSPNRAEPGGRP